jgi:hypothetical protein
VLWLVAPLSIGPVLADALSGASAAVGTTAAVLLWSVWTVVLVAVLVPRMESLTVVRLGAPAGLPLALWAAVAGSDGGLGGAAALGAVWSGVTALVALSAGTADAFIDGSSYGAERRFLLRTPGLLLLGPLELAWAAVVVGVAAGPLWLAANAWVVGVVALAMGWPLAWGAARAIHQLSRRWLVLVPGGVVLHDPLALGEAMLFPRSVVARVGPADAHPSEGGALDLTLRAVGLVSEIRLHEDVDLAVRQGRGDAVRVDTSRVLVAPARPGTLVREAEHRGIPTR